MEFKKKCGKKQFTDFIGHLHSKKFYSNVIARHGTFLNELFMNLAYHGREMGIFCLISRLVVLQSW